MQHNKRSYYSTVTVRSTSHWGGVKGVWASNWGGTLDFGVWALEFVLAGFLEGLNTVAAVEVEADLLVSLNEDLEFFVKVAVLLLKNVNMLLEGGNLTAETSISVWYTSVRELGLIILLANNINLIFSRSDFTL